MLTKIRYVGLVSVYATSPTCYRVTRDRPNEGTWEERMRFGFFDQLPCAPAPSLSDPADSLRLAKGRPCLSRSRPPRLGRVAAFFSQPALIALPITLLVAPGIAVVSGGDLRPWRAPRRCKPLAQP